MKRNGRKRDKENEHKREGEENKNGVPFLSKIYKKLGDRLLSEQEVKSVHATRATRGYQNLGVSSNSKR